MTSGHDLARQQIARHGRDRYPTLLLQLNKVIAECTELAEAIDAMDRGRMRMEYADVGLALFELGNKLGLDLGECMTALVAADNRDFRDGG